MVDLACSMCASSGAKEGKFINLDKPLNSNDKSKKILQTLKSLERRLFKVVRNKLELTNLFELQHAISKIRKKIQKKN